MSSNAVLPLKLKHEVSLAMSNLAREKIKRRGAEILHGDVLKGIDLEGGIRVERAIETDSVLQTKIDAAIKGAEIVKSEFTNDDGCIVTLRLLKKRLQEMMGVKFK